MGGLRLKPHPKPGSGGRTSNITFGEDGEKALTDWIDEPEALDTSRSTWMRYLACITLRMWRPCSYSGFARR